MPLYGQAGRDSATLAQKGIDENHHEVHEGDHYLLTYSVADLGAATSPADMMTLSWKAPNTTKWLVKIG